ncbi:hypothetical protein P7C71_g5445, partial [Lecanoromycetidae sp. Uapishka_2]
MSNTTSDDWVHGWVSSNCGRGTIDILWSCLSAIFLCVWTVIHLPVPRYNGEAEHSLRTKIVRSKIVPALIGLFVPEYSAMIALDELVEARHAKHLMRIHLGGDNFTLSRGFFLKMGGFYLKSASGVCHPLLKYDIHRLTHNYSRLFEDPVTQVKAISQDQIDDCANADTFTKLIACVQGIWLMSQVISRLCQHRAVTLLEVSSTAYVCCAIIAYVAWWKKPQDCNLPIFITCSDEAMKEIQDKFWDGNALGHSWAEFLWAGRLPIGAWSLKTRRPSTSFSSLTLTDLWALIAPTIAVGGVHIASWNIGLPSKVEHWMWRASTICCSIIPVLFAILVHFYDQRTSRLRHKVLAFLLFLTATLYGLTRLYMIVEVFLSLRTLPPSAFECIQWSSFVPHI